MWLTNLLFSSIQSADGSFMCTMVLNDYQIHVQWYFCAVVILDISSLSESESESSLFSSQTKV